MSDVEGAHTLCRLRIQLSEAAQAVDANRGSQVKNGQSVEKGEEEKETFSRSIRTTRLAHLNWGAGLLLQRGRLWALSSSHLEIDDRLSLLVFPVAQNGKTA